MIFRSKMDAYYFKSMIIVVLIIALSSFFPLFIDDIPVAAILILTLIILILISFLLWVNVSIRYIFRENYLLIKGGPFRSKIPYESITKVTTTNAIFSGYSIVTSRDAIEIFSNTTFYGSIKISPYYKSEFMKVLIEKAPHIQIVDFNQ